MPGAIHNAINDIKVIANTLRDLYKSGFPVLKEIIQNADDAGASHLIIGWSDGLANAEHPLLGDPAVFFINNAPLKPEDVQGIMSIALGSKTDNKEAVGKFGLGMKSLFHLGEVFFFMGNNWRSSTEKANVFNPWADYREQWDIFSEHDKALMESSLAGLTNQLVDSDSFVVWVPLRSQNIMDARGDSSAVIIKSKDYGRTLPDFLGDEELAEQVAKLIPLLKCINNVHLYKLESNNNHKIFSVSLNDDSGRIAYGRGINKQDWTGKILIEYTKKEPSKTVIEFAGNEVILNQHPFTDFKNHPDWPSSYGRSEGFVEIQIPDKAEPHAAVVIMRKPALNHATLNIRWAVFLPLGEQDISQIEQSYTIPLNGEYSYDVLLHGYFFIDAGRVGIHGQRKIGSNESIEINNEEDLIFEWNRNLANQGTLTCLPLALNSLANSFKLNTNEIESLSTGLNDFLKKRQNLPDLLPWITKNNQWLYCINKQTITWKMVDSDRAVRLIPAPVGKPASEDYQRIWTTLPGLINLSNKVILAEAFRPNILSSNNSEWKISEVEDLLKVDVNVIFSSQQNLKYLNDFLKYVFENNFQMKSELQQSLIELTRKVFSLYSLRDLSKIKQLFQGYLRNIQSHKRQAFNLKKEAQDVWHAMNQISSDVLLIPDFLEPEEAKSSGNVSFEDTIKLLEIVSNIPKKETETLNNIESIVINLLGKLSPPDRKEVDRRCRHLSLFKAQEIPERRSKLVSREKLNELHFKHQLFTYSGAGNMGLGLSLKNALFNTTMLFVTEQINQGLFERKVPKCEPEFALKLISNLPELNSVNERVDILTKLSGIEIKTPSQEKAFRYLLHGNPNADPDCKLWVPTEASEIWSKIWEQCISQQELAWSVIPGQLSRELVHKHKSILNIHEIEPANVLEELGEAIIELDFSEIVHNQTEAEEILSHIDDKNLWCKLPLHTTSENERVSISELCILDGGIALPEDLEKGIIHIRHANSQQVKHNQSQWIGKLDDEKAIRIALQQKEPILSSEFIIQTLEHLNDEIDEELKNLLKQANWLSVNGKAVSPQQIINLESAVFPEAHKLCLHDVDCYLICQLDDDYQQHLKILAQFFIPPNEASKILFEQASRLPEYSLGECQSISEKALQQASQYLDTFSMLPGWLLVLECFEAFQESIAISDIHNLCKVPSSPDELVKVHQTLSNELLINSAREIRTCLLWAICSLPDPISYLKKMRLRACNDQYYYAQELTVHVIGIDPKYLIHKDEWNVLSALLAEKSQNVDEQDKNTMAQSDLLEQSAIRLKNYFKDWNNYVPEECIAAVLALMSGDSNISDLSNEFLRQRSVHGLLSVMGEQWEETSYFSKMNLQQSVEKMRFSIEQIQDNELFLSSIFGEKIKVNLALEPTSIFVWDSHNFKHSYQVGVRLCPINIANMGEERLVNILKDSAEILLKKVYVQPNIQLNDLWADLSKVEQLDISVAKGIILNEVTRDLKSLKINKPPIGQLLRDYRTEIRRENEAEQNNQKYKSQRNKILSEINLHIENDTQLQKTLLEAMRKKVEEYQYRPESVPFELFQNADDAVEERLELEGIEQKIPAIYKRFVMNSNESFLHFYHWGREVNQFRSFEGNFDGKSRGFDADLEKMLTLNISDKGEETTGKFGLGFKSCLLVSDNPEIYSGRLAVRVNAGLLPMVSPYADILSKHVKEQTLEQRSPTLIYLQLRENINSENIIAEFRRTAGISTIFAKQLRTIIIDENEYSWMPKKCQLIQGLSFGHAILPMRDGKLRKQRVAHYQTKNGQFLFQLGNKGFTSLLERQLSKIWVLNPLSETVPMGFIIEGDFQIDIGRSQLARKSQANEKLMKYLGSDLADFFKQIYQWSKDNWDDFLKEWDFDSSSTPELIWHSVWKVLTDGWSKRLDDVDQNGELDSGSGLIQQLFMASGAMVDFYQQTPVLPTELSHVTHSLTTLNSVKYYADPLLSRLIENIAAVPMIHEALIEGQLVSDKMGEFFKDTGLISQLNISKMDLIKVVENSVPENKISPALADDLGNIFTEQFEKRLTEQKATKEQVDYFKKILAKLEFMSEQQTWRASNVLLVEKNKNEEEFLKAKFAPNFARLSSQYENKGLNFFLFCREKYRFSLNDMSEWATSTELAANENRQKALCRYLVSGDSGEELASELLYVPWVNRLDAAVLQNWNWSKKDIDKLLNFLLASDSERDKRVDEQLKGNSKAQFSAEESLNNIYEWWQSEGESQLERYEQRLYPGGNFQWSFIQDDDINNLNTRKAWLKLLYLGSCQTIGRSKEVHHRGAVNWFEQQGWWDIFANPEIKPTKWFNILDEYLEYSVTKDQYRNWLQILPLYRYTKNLEDYIDLFWSSEQFLDNINDILKPGSSDKLSGSGIKVPELKATLGIGINFILRELVRNKVMDHNVLAEHCYVASYAVRNLLGKLDCPIDELKASPSNSSNIYQFISDEIGEEKATFDLCFDIPFRIISEDPSLQEKLLGIGQWEVD